MLRQISQDAYIAAEPTFTTYPPNDGEFNAIYALSSWCEELMTARCDYLRAKTAKNYISDTASTQEVDPDHLYSLFGLPEAPPPSPPLSLTTDCDLEAAQDACALDDPMNCEWQPTMSDLLCPRRSPSLSDDGEGVIDHLLNLFDDSVAEEPPDDSPILSSDEGDVDHLLILFSESMTAPEGVLP